MNRKILGGFLLVLLLIGFIWAFSGKSVHITCGYGYEGNREDIYGTTRNIDYLLDRKVVYGYYLRQEGLLELVNGELREKEQLPQLEVLSGSRTVITFSDECTIW